MKLKLFVAILVMLGLREAQAFGASQSESSLKKTTSSPKNNVPVRVPPPTEHHKSIYKDQTISYHYECFGRTVDVSAIFKVPNENFRLTSFRVTDTATNDETDLTPVFTQHIENIYGMKSLKFVCHSSELYIYAIISNANPWDPLEALDKKRGGTFTINKKNEVEEGLRFRRKGN